MPRSPTSLWIAVLPFTIRGADPDAHRAGRRASPRTSPPGCRGSPASRSWRRNRRAASRTRRSTSRQIAERLNARYIIGGSVRKSASGIRITAHLIDARSGAQLWTETYDRRADDTRHLCGAGRRDRSHRRDRGRQVLACWRGRWCRRLKERALDTLARQAMLLLRCWNYDAPARVLGAWPAAVATRSVSSRASRNWPTLWAELAELYGWSIRCTASTRVRSRWRGRVGRRRERLDLDPMNQHAWHVLAVDVLLRARRRRVRSCGGARAGPEPAQHELHRVSGIPVLPARRVRPRVRDDGARDGDQSGASRLVSLRLLQSSLHPRRVRRGPGRSAGDQHAAEHVVPVGGRGRRRAARAGGRGDRGARRAFRARAGIRRRRRASRGERALAVEQAGRRRTRHGWLSKGHGIEGRGADRLAPAVVGRGPGQSAGRPGDCTPRDGRHQMRQPRPAHGLP